MSKKASRPVQGETPTYPTLAGADRSWLATTLSLAVSAAAATGCSGAQAEPQAPAQRGAPKPVPGVAVPPAQTAGPPQQHLGGAPPPPRFEATTDAGCAPATTQATPEGRLGGKPRLPDVGEPMKVPVPGK